MGLRNVRSEREHWSHADSLRGNDQVNVARFIWANDITNRTRFLMLPLGSASDTGGYSRRKGERCLRSYREAKGDPGKAGNESTRDCEGFELQRHSIAS